MKRLQKLFSGKLTAYQIATATDINIETIEDLLSEKISLDDIEPEQYIKLTELETGLFSDDTQKEEAAK